jgi:glucose-1-phosphate thymidylyltransferase
VKGILLAGGSGTRLHPITMGVTKHLLPVYDKPMIYYPLSVLMLAGIRDVMVVGRPEDVPAYERLLGDGSQLGIRIRYGAQDSPDGIAHGLLVGADFAAGEPIALVLGDNIFHGPGLSGVLQEAVDELSGATLFGYTVSDPERFAVAEVDTDGRLTSMTEKPRSPRSSIALTGLYLYDHDVFEVARQISPSARGELEITDVNRVYLEQTRARLTLLGRGYAWIDTGTHDALLEASVFVQTMERRQGFRIACVEEIALRMGFIDAAQCAELARRYAGSGYGAYIEEAAASMAGVTPGLEPDVLV